MLGHRGDTDGDAEALDDAAIGGSEAVNAYGAGAALTDETYFIAGVSGEQNEEAPVGLVAHAVVGAKERHEQPPDVGGDRFGSAVPGPFGEGVELVELGHEEGGVLGRRRAVQDRTGNVVEGVAGGG